MIRCASDLPDWTPATEAGNLVVFRRALDVRFLASPAFPSIPIRYLGPGDTVEVLPTPPRAPADETEAITNLARAGFYVHLLEQRED